MGDMLGGLWGVACPHLSVTAPVVPPPPHQGHQLAMADPSHIQSAASKSIRPFRSSEEYLEAMKEDLAEWFNTLYDLDIQVDTFLESLETGCHLCRHANNVNRIALDFQQRHPEVAAHMRVPQNEVIFQAKNVVPGSFIARDNVSNFIQWCRQDLGIQDVLMFETNDLVLKKNEKNFVLCLLEVARRGSKFGMLAPMLIQMEEEIEEEMRDQMGYGVLGMRQESRDLQVATYPGRARPITLCDLKNLDELVRHAPLGALCLGPLHPPNGLLYGPWEGLSVHPTGCSMAPGRSCVSLWLVGGPVCPPNGVLYGPGMSSLSTQPGSPWPVGGPLCPPNQALRGPWEVLGRPARPTCPVEPPDVRRGYFGGRGHNHRGHAGVTSAPATSSRQLEGHSDPHLGNLLLAGSGPPPPPQHLGVLSLETWGHPGC